MTDNISQNDHENLKKISTRKYCDPFSSKRDVHIISMNEQEQVYKNTIL